MTARTLPQAAPLQAPALDASSGTHYDSLLFAAVGAFAAAQRPGREDANRLDELAQPLLALASVEGKRRIAAVLSECRSIIPERLVEHLLLEPLDISAALLISRADVPDAILERVISLRGADHARIIAMRQRLSSNIKARIDALIEALTTPSSASASAPAAALAAPSPALPGKEHPPMPSSEHDHATKTAAAAPDTEATRNALRRMMMRQTVREDLNDRMVFSGESGSNLVARLINLALAGDPDFLATALADEWRLPFPAIRRAIRRHDTPTIMALLKGLDLGATDTFAIMAALRPLGFASAEGIAGFYLAYQRMDDAAIAATRNALDITAPMQQKSA
jgi:uncharacterized protein (DUF2336 family)